MVKSFKDVIDHWSLPSELADDIGAKANTVSKWGQRDFIPAEWWSAIEGAAQERGFEGISVGVMAQLAERLRQPAA